MISKSNLPIDAFYVWYYSV